MMTQRLAGVFEAAIARHPEDWHMLQKVFVADLDPGRLARPQNAGGQRGPQEPARSPGRAQLGGRRGG
jgi:KDO2-lipid IV(A) lauroyltransferase